MKDISKVKVGLEATGHYSYNLLGYLLDKCLTTFVINPLHTNLYRKSLSLIQIIMPNLQLYMNILFHNITMFSIKNTYNITLIMNNT